MLVLFGFFWVLVSTKIVIKFYTIGFGYVGGDYEDFWEDKVLNFSVLMSFVSFNRVLGWNNFTFCLLDCLKLKFF